MTNKELLEKITRLEAELAEVKEKAEAMKKDDDGGLFKPENGQKYWFISYGGNIHRNSWDNYLIDLNCYEIGNCFPTEQSAKDAVRVLKLIQKARESQDGFVPDWEDMTQEKYYLYFDGEESCIIGHIYRNIAPIFGFWVDVSACEKFITNNYHELLWFFTEYRR